MRTSLVWFTVITVLAISVVGCSDKSEVAAPPAPEVVVSHPVEKQVTDYLEFTGTTQAVESVDIRARVRGFLEKQNFHPGAKVKAGDVLFEIDPREFKARVDQSQAAVEQNEAQRKLAQIRLDKSKNLLSSGSVSELSFLEEQGKRDVEKAQVDRAQADLEKAKLDLGFTQVKTPISGTVGVNEVDVGNLVGANENTLLTHVVNDDFIYVYFNISERDLLKYKRIDRGEADRKEMKAFMSLADEPDFPHKGVVDYLDPRTDPGTGTVRARAVFANPKGFLMAGLFARVRLPLGARDAVLIPELALGTDQRGEYALVVDQNNMVEYRPVTTGSQVDRMRVIEKGLSTQDWVVVRGIQRARPGSKVTPIKEGAQPAIPPVQGSAQPAGK